MTHLLPVSACYCHKKKTMESLGSLTGKENSSSRKKVFKLVKKIEKAMAWKHPFGVLNNIIEETCSPFIVYFKVLGLVTFLQSLPMTISFNPSDPSSRNIFSSSWSSFRKSNLSRVSMYVSYVVEKIKRWKDNPNSTDLAVQVNFSDLALVLALNKTFSSDVEV